MRNYEKIQLVLDAINKGELEYHKDGYFLRNGKKVNGDKRGKGGYLALSKSVNGKRYRVFTHLVVYAYHHGLEELKKHETIDHINEDKYDNRIENLRGASRFENSLRSCFKNNYSKLTVKQVIEIKQKLKDGETTVSLGKEYGVSNVTISKIKRGLRFKYV
jgi:uncharacterized protein YerC